MLLTLFLTTAGSGLVTTIHNREGRRLSMLERITWQEFLSGHWTWTISSEPNIIVVKICDKKAR